MAAYKNSQSKASTEYNKRSTVCFTVRLNVNTDSDIIAALESCANKNAMVKRLIREAIGSDNDNSEV
ncbi:MAG: hypothetical protein IK122_02620 [Alphaproteobacteria bacterium]|nr:hypothetical protein [Alphaproteobacteria bacterium]